MVALEFPALEHAIPVLGLLWLGSALLLVVSMRRYAASRSHPPAQAEFAFTQRRLSEVSAESTTSYGRAAIPEASRREPGQPASPARLTLALEAVRARVAHDRQSAQGLVELIRALYLDGSAFTFATIAELPVEDRALANALIETWLADPSAVDVWRGAYDSVREVDATPS